jgi:hypothetical protein
MCQELLDFSIILYNWFAHFHRQKRVVYIFQSDTSVNLEKFNGRLKYSAFVFKIHFGISMGTSYFNLKYLTIIRIIYRHADN